jgi:neutral ceramidase
MSGWKAGAASQIFTPDEPMWLAGYAARTEPAKGKLSELRAKALALEDANDERLLILTVDLIAVQLGPTAAGVAEHLHHRHGLPRERIVMAASHTHYGPEIRPDKALFFGIPPEYAGKIDAAAARVRRAMCDAADGALASLKPVRLTARQTSARFADNRRKSGDVTDHDVPVLEVIRDGDRIPLAVVFGYACHNTTIPPEDCRYCGDWAGFAQERLEQQHAGCTAMFITGAAADQNPHPRGSVELSKQYGRELADAVTASLQSSTSRDIAPRLRVAHEYTPLPLKPIDRAVLEANLASTDMPTARKAKFLLDALARNEKLITEYPAPIQAVRFGDELLMVALSGEPVNDFAHRFKRDFAADGRQVWVAGYCNDMYGYVPTRRIQLEGGYEGGRANLWSWVPMPFDETVEQRVVDAVHRLVAKVSS